MSDLIALDSQGSKIESLNLRLLPKPLGKGGEGQVYKLDSKFNNRDICFKIYQEKYRTDERFRKVRYMLVNTPRCISNNNSQLCWPIAQARDIDGFCGYLMPTAFDKSIELHEITKPKRHWKLSDDWERFFDHDAQNCLLRLKICVNICAAVEMLHSSKRYTFVDLKPNNIMIDLAGRVSIVDLDSIQIRRTNGFVYHARVNTEGYTPPEGSGLLVSNEVIEQNWDRFSLAVILYQVMFCIHPYTASFKEPFANFNTLGDKIEHNLFVHGPYATFITSDLKPHRRFYKLHSDIKQLFMQAFCSTSRPTAAQWGETLFNHIQNSTHGVSY